MKKWNLEAVKLCGEQWKEAMAHTENFSAEIRSKRAVDSHADRTVESFEKGMGSSAERVEDTMKRLEERGYRKMDMTVLDVGGGTGTFTLPFAREYRQVDTLDISVPMQQRIREKAAKEQLENIRYLCKNWHTLDVEREGMKKQYALVLSSITCRGIYNAETLHKMNQCSRGGCCLLTWAGQSRSSHGKNLQEIILGRTLETAGGNDIIFPFQMIYHMGGRPDLNYSRVAWSRGMEPEEAVSEICSSYWRFADITEGKKEEIRSYVYEHLEEGRFVERVEHLIGIMVWDAWRIPF